MTNTLHALFLRLFPSRTHSSPSTVRFVLTSLSFLTHTIWSLVADHPIMQKKKASRTVPFTTFPGWKVPLIHHPDEHFSFLFLPSHTLFFFFFRSGAVHHHYHVRLSTPCSVSFSIPFFVVDFFFGGSVAFISVSFFCVYALISIP